MIRLKNHLIGRAIAISAITIIIFSVAVMSISSYTKLSVDGFSSVTPQPQPPSQNTPTADNKTIQTNLNIPVQINLTAKTPPTVNDIHIQTNMNTPIEITLTGTDSIPRDVLKFSVVNLPQHGNLTHSINPNSVLYTPDAGFSGTDSFTYKATDSQGLDNSKLATVIMTVNGSSDDSNNLVDPFGIKEIYPTKAGGEQWFMNMSDITHDPRTSFTASNPDLTRNPDGSWKVSSTEVRFNVFPSSGYHHELITTLNQQQLETKGYMQSPNDWKDVEITGYLKLNKQGGDIRGNSGALVGGHFTLYARGGKHIGFGASQGGCEATSYHADWAYDGTTRFAKEQWHVSYVFTPFKSATDPIIDKWVGFKMIIYNIQQNGTTAVEMEIWVDPNNNGNWIKANDFVDSGGWGKAGGECGGAPDQIISWGGPIVTYRWDNSPDVDIKDFSVREIQAPQ
ncbi:MAG: Ig-like domain-containing protein [Candidatus Nitrosopolaris sp.]